MKTKYKVFLLILASILYLFSSVTARAQTQKGITVSPSVTHIDLATDPAQYELTYINNASYSVTLTLSVQDFSELNDSYQINYLSPKDAANYKYSLSSWISFENNNLELNPGEQKTVKVFIDKDRITKGGHYAAILAEIGSPDSKQNANVRAVLASLLFVRANTGHEVEDGQIVTFQPSRDWLDFPDSFIVRFQNNGNVYVVPYGLVKIYDPLGNQVAQTPFNISSLDALPQSIRRYDVAIEPFQKVLLPGFYTATANLHFGDTNKQISAKVRFFSQGSFNFVEIGIGLIVILILLFYFRNKMRRKHT
jgi:uncharacterized membrane protein